MSTSGSSNATTGEVAGSDDDGIILPMDLPVDDMSHATFLNWIFHNVVRDREFHLEEGVDLHFRFVQTSCAFRSLYAALVEKDDKLAAFEDENERLHVQWRYMKERVCNWHLTA